LERLGIIWNHLERIFDTVFDTGLKFLIPLFPIILQYIGSKVQKYQETRFKISQNPLQLRKMF